MHTANAKLERVQRFRFFCLPWMAAVALFSSLLVSVRSTYANQPAQPSYPSAEQASQALYDAAQANNERMILQILGGQKELATSGDELEDKAERKQFVAKYAEMHRLVRQTDGSTALYIGAENWPFPVPLISENGKWRFDAHAGTQEIFFRRIGENEAVAIQVCHALVQTITGNTSETASSDPVTRYAQILVSAHKARASNPAIRQGASTSFDGYYFRQVSRDAEIVDGDVIFVAYPVEYRSSGVMTFVITSDDVVFEKDLGPETATLAKTIGKHTLDLSWQLAE